MRTRKFWVPVVCSLIVTPPALLLGFASGGAGHGDYFAAILLFPYTMLSALALGYIHVPFILFAIAQFPAYGISLGFANERGNFTRMLMILLITHLACVAAVLMLAGKVFE